MKKYGNLGLRVLILFAMFFTTIFQPMGAVQAAASPYGNSLSFDGVDDTIALSNLPVNTATGGKNTVQFWMYWTGKAPVMPFGWAGSYDLEFTSGYFGFNTGNGDVFGIPSTNLKNQWVHVTAVFTNGLPDTNELYINGVKQTIKRYVGTSSISRSASTTAFISGWGRSTGYKFAGSLADVRIWNVARTPEAIQADYNTVLNGDEQGLIAYYKLDTIATGKVYPAVSNSAPGISSGFAAPALAPHTTTLTDTTAALAWSPVSTATAYTVTRDGQVIYSGADTMTTDKDLTAATAYQFAVTAQNSFGESKPVPYSVTTREVTLAQPANFLGTPSSNSVALTWDAVTDATGYVLKRNGAAVYTGSATTFHDQNLLADTDYTYTLAATSANAESQPVSLNVRTTSIVVGQPSTSVTMDGQDDEYRFTNLAVNTTAGGKNTVEFWMNWNGTSSQMPFGWDTGYNLEFVGGYFGFNSSENNVMGVSAAPLKGKWVHVAAVFTNGVPTIDNLELYINGQKQPLIQGMGTTARYGKSATPTAYLSGWGRTTGYKFGGKVANLRIWDHARSQAQIQNSINQDVLTGASGLIGSWNPSLIATGSVYDLGGGNNGTAKGFTQPQLFPSATAQDTSSITIQWSKIAPSETIRYVLKRDGVQVYEGQDASFTDTRLEANKEYVYTLIAKDSFGETAPYIINAKTEASLVDTPTNLAAVPTANTVALTWDDAADETVTYAVYRNDSPVYGGDANSFTDTALTPETEYTYSVYAKKDSYTSAPATVTVKTLEAPVLPPVTPTGFKAEPTDTSVTLTWDAQSNSAAYTLYRNDVEIVTGPNTSYTDTGLTAGTSYTYKVIAANKAGQSQAASVTVTTKLSAPANLRIGEITTDSIEVLWDGQPGLTYEMYANGRSVLGAYTNYRKLTDLTHATTYTIELYAKPSYNGTPSMPAKIQATTLTAPTPEAPATFTAEATDKTVSLSWPKVDNAEFYTITRNGYSLYTTSNNTTLSYLDTSVASATTYNYAVYAKTKFTSSPAKTVTVTTKAAPTSLPTAPTNFRVVNTAAGSLTLAWDPVANASLYMVKRSGYINEEWSGQETQYVNKTFNPGTTYTFEVYAKNGLGTSQPSAKLSVTVTTPPPLPAPTNLQATEVTDLQVKLSWNQVPGAQYYRIYRNGTSLGWTTGATATTYTDSTAKPETQYTYTVYSEHFNVKSATAASVTVKTLYPTVPYPKPITNLKATPTHNTMTLTWTAGANAQKYDIYRGNAYYQTVYNGTTFTDYNLVADKAYLYGVEASNVSGNSTRVSLTVRTLPAPVTAPATPTNFTATTTEYDATLSWSAVTGATSYDLKRDGVTIASGLTATSYADKNLTPATTYVYTVVAKNSGGASQPTTLNVTTKALPPATEPPGTPANFKVTTTTTSTATFTWDAATQAKTYELKRDGKVVYSGNALTFMDTGLTSDYSYNYTLSAVNELGSSTPIPLRVTTQVSIHIPPAPPTGVTTDATDTSIIFKWNPAVSDNWTYKIERKELNGTTVTTVVEGLKAAGYTDAGLKANTTYVYYLYIHNGYQDSAPLEVTITTKAPVIAAPSGLKATATNDGILLTWDKSSFGAGYFLTAMQGSGGYSVVLESDATSFLDTNVIPGLTYTYTLEYIFQDDEGPYPAATVTATAIEPVDNTPAPTSFHAQATNDGILLTWDKPPFNARYFLSAMIDGTGYSMELEYDQTSFLDKYVTPGLTYTYTLEYIIEGTETRPPVSTVTATAVGPVKSTVGSEPTAASEENASETVPATTPSTR
ncbi:fibronectin type III domain-containing protein [Brevibacillus dissolubilis]|uniref:fibronectin type III domain-containing protein n=1 Tax=Brevibacillus dissolubilis TaxID=1844116 RepID=UPI001115D527|nr:LamG-like jellyroll fold domain-containing protein [Brevibacillus dissolubilis]